MLLAQVGPDHVRVGGHLCGRAGADRPAEVDHHHPVGQVHHQAHVVLDHDDRDAQLVADVEDEAGHVLGLLEVHPGHRLVEQQQLGLHGQRAAELDPLLDAVGQQADREPPPLLQLEEVDDVLDRCPVEQLAPAGPAEPGERGQHAVRVVVVAAEHQVVQHGQVGEQLDVLECAGHARARRSRAGACRSDSVPSKVTRPDCGR